MNIISPQDFRNAEPIDRMFFIKRHFGTMTAVSKKFNPTLAAFSRAINGDPRLASFLIRISESKTFLDKYELEKLRLQEKQASGGSLI